MWLLLHLENDLMLRDHVPMRDDNRLWQARRATAEQPRSSRLRAELLIVIRDPVCLSSFEQLRPRLQSSRDGLVVRVEDADIPLGNARLLACSLHAGDQLWLGKHESYLCGFEMMRELQRRVAGICTGEDPSCADDGENKHAVVDLPLSVFLLSLGMPDDQGQEIHH